MTIRNMTNDICPRCAGARLLQEFGVIRCPLCGYLKSGKDINVKKKHVSLGEYMSAANTLEVGKTVPVEIQHQHICRHNQDVVQMGKYKVWLSEVPGKKWKWEKPDLGVYMAVPWLSFAGNVLTNGIPLTTMTSYDIIFISWPDRGIIDKQQLVPVVNKILDYLEEGRQVEIGCFGGHGRTGTVAACVLGIAEHLDGDMAIDEIRKRYCTYAIEGILQEQLVRDFLRR